MSWAEIDRRYRNLVEARDSGAPMRESWRAFREVVGRTRDCPPYHLRTLIGLVRRVAGERGRDDIVILDHGCGGGLTLLYLLALGHTGIHGANVQGKCEAWNRLLAEEYGIITRRFSLYDGRRLPLSDGSVDLVFSQQVIEHVADELVEHYYAEEGRVLRPGGLAYHQVPHRLSPYDSHTRLWLVHWLPKAWRRPIYRALGRDIEHIEKWTHLRWPGAHRSRLARYIGVTHNLTVERLRDTTEMDYYDGSIGLRRALGGMMRTPVVGKVLAPLAAQLVMLDTLTVKGAERPA